MGIYVQVNLDYLSDAMAKVDTYRNERNSLITQMSNEVNNLTSGWQADDASAFISHWAQMREQDGIFTIVDTQLQNYYEILYPAEITFEQKRTNKSRLLIFTKRDASDGDDGQTVYTDKSVTAVTTVTEKDKLIHGISIASTG